MTDDRPVVHLLHVGKTGGTVLGDAFRRADAGAPVRVIHHPHEVRAVDLPPGEPFVFTVRDPVARFVSGFHSRQRCGRPRYDIPHRPEEAVAFARFRDAYALGAALSSTDPGERAAAERAMRDIRHVRSSYWDWFIDPRTLRERAPSCLAMLHCETLTNDAAVLATRLGIEGFTLAGDATSRHSNPQRRPPPPQVVATAQANLRRWYQADYAFLRLAESLFDAVGSHPASR